MKSVPRGPRRRALGTLFLCLVSVVAASGAPQVSVKSTALPNAYSKVYVSQIKNDGAKIYPKMLARLQKAGLEVMELKLENLPFASQGSGFLLSPEGHVLTCAHVVGTEPQATLWVQGTRYVGRVLASDTNLDAAIVLIEGSPPTFNPLFFAAGTNYHLGQDVFTMGFPMADVLGSKPRLNKGLINSTAGLGDNPQGLQISTEVQPGNSGGPLLNEHGEVLGMVASTMNPLRFLIQSGGDLPQNVNFAIKAGPLREYLTRSGVSLPTTTNGTAFSGFEDVEKSLALIRGGIVEEKRLHERPLVCRCSYLTGYQRHLVRLRLDLIDVRELKIVISASLDHESFSSADTVLDALFTEIYPKLFPDRPNPFSSKKSKT